MLLIKNGKVWTMADVNYESGDILVEGSINNVYLQTI